VEGNVTVLPGEDAVLTCHVASNVAYRITWSKINGGRFDRRRFELIILLVIMKYAINMRNVQLDNNN